MVRSNGYTHFNKVSGINGVYVGANGSEELIASASGGNVVLTVNISSASPAYIPIPFDMAMNACYADISSGALGTAVALALFANDTAGTALCTAISMGASAATAGSGLVTVGTLSTATLSALSSLCVIMSSGTACGATVTVVGHRV